MLQSSAKYKVKDNILSSDENKVLDWLFNHFKSNSACPDVEIGYFLSELKKKLKSWDNDPKGLLLDKITYRLVLQLERPSGTPDIEIGHIQDLAENYVFEKYQVHDAFVPTECRIISTIFFCGLTQEQLCVQIGWHYPHEDVFEIDRKVKLALHNLLEADKIIRYE